MRAPKLLPWIARKAGIPDELALKLWRRAAGETEVRLGKADGAEYYGLAVERWLSLVEDEASASRQDDGAGVGWMWRHQKRMALHALTATQSLVRNWENLWRRARRAGCPVR